MKSNFRFALSKRLLFLVSVAIFVNLTSCKPITAHPQSNHADELYWITSGGGQIEFTLVENGEQYDVTVTSFAFQKRNAHFSIRKENKEVYAAIGRVLANQEEIELITNNAPTGSWTTITFKNRRASTVYENLSMTADLEIIYSTIVASL